MTVHTERLGALGDGNTYSSQAHHQHGETIEVHQLFWRTPVPLSLALALIGQVSVDLTKVNVRPWYVR
jgi:hypothetical protein